MKGGSYRASSSTELPPAEVRVGPRRRDGRLAVVVAFVMLGGSPLPTAAQVPGDASAPDVVVFYGTGCPHCGRALEWLDDLATRRPALRMESYDVVSDAGALEALRALSEERGLAGVSVPTFVVRGRHVHIGFDDAETTGRLIEELLASGPAADGSATAAAASDVESLRSPSITVPLIGSVALDDVGLPVFTVVLGLLDGFNPCAMWVLLFLLSMLVHVESRARMALVGGVFVGVSGLVYYAFMAAWLNAFLLLGMARWIQVALGGLAILMGAMNVKDFRWLGRGPSLGIPDSAKPGIYARARRVVTAESLGAALGTVAVLALLVNTVELLCTAGLPALYTRVLTLRELPALTYHAYLALYDVFYMLDDALMLGVAIVTLGHRRLQAHEARWLKLVSGVVMLALGILLLVEPSWLMGG